MNQPALPSTEDRLDSWKDIAVYLKRDAERRALDTVQTFAPASAPRSLARLHWMRGAVMTALVLASIAYLFISSRVATTPRSIRSVAVLPLQNLSGDSGQDFFVDGMTEALIERLSSMQGVRVISRTSVM